MKKFYKICMDERANQIDAVAQIQSLLRATMGWPMIMSPNQWNAKCMPWQAVDNYYSKLVGNSTFYSINLVGGYRSDYYTLQIQNSLFYHDQYKNRQTYRSLIKEVANALIRENNATVPNTQLDKDIDDLINLEDELHEAVGISDVKKKIENLPSFIQDWNRITRNFAETRIDWDKVFQRIFVVSNVRPSVHASATLLPYDYFTDLPAILQSTNKRTIVNFIQWKFLSKILPHATEKMENLFYKAKNNVNDVQNKPPRWVHCVDQIGRNYASYSLFIESYYSQNSRENAGNLYRELLDRMSNQLKNSNWLSSSTKNSAKRKINSITSVLGYSTFYNNDEKIIDYFKDLIIGDSYFLSTLNFIRHGWKARMKYWGQPSGSIESLDDPLYIRAAYQPRLNAISVRAGFLQSPLLDGMVPNYVTYGSVGSIIGHEISHALDYEDFSRTLTRNEHSSYNEVVQCFINIYDTYFRMAETIFGTYIKNPSLRGLATRDENLADWNGVQVGFQAYKKMKREKLANGEFKLPGFEGFTDEKMFFISFAQSWCNENYNDDATDVHSPGYLRVVGTLSNIPEFAAAFNCSRSSPMNPERKCHLWTI